MKPLGLVSQILAIVLAVAIAFLFVRPTFNEIGALQTDIEQYKTERQRVAQINQSLANKVATLQSIPNSEVERITRYMPSFIDEVAVLRDIEIIASAAGVTYNSIDFESIFTVADAQDQSRSNAQEPVLYSFAVSVEGSYERIKAFLSFLEQNHYPLQVYAVTMSEVEGGLMQLDATVVTYIDEQLDLVN